MRGDRVVVDRTASQPPRLAGRCDGLPSQPACLRLAVLHRREHHVQLPNHRNVRRIAERGHVPERGLARHGGGRELQPAGDGPGRCCVSYDRPDAGHQLSGPGRHVHVHRGRRNLQRLPCHLRGHGRLRWRNVGGDRRERELLQPAGDGRWWQPIRCRPRRRCGGRRRLAAGCDASGRSSSWTPALPRARLSDSPLGAERSIWASPAPSKGRPWCASSSPAPQSRPPRRRRKSRARARRSRDCRRILAPTAQRPPDSARRLAGIDEGVSSLAERLAGFAERRAPAFPSPPHPRLPTPRARRERTSVRHESALPHAASRHGALATIAHRAAPLAHWVEPRGILAGPPCPQMAADPTRRRASPPARIAAPCQDHGRPPGSPSGARKLRGALLDSLGRPREPSGAPRASREALPVSRASPGTHGDAPVAPGAEARAPGSRKARALEEREGAPDPSSQARAPSAARATPSRGEDRTRRQCRSPRMYRSGCKLPCARSRRASTRSSAGRSGR